VVVGFFGICSVGCYAESFESLSEQLGARTLEAEQVWPAATPSLPGLFGLGLDILRFFDDGYSRVGDVPPKYLPESRNVLPIPLVEMPLSDVHWLCDGSPEECLAPFLRRRDGDGQSLFAFPFHPHELQTRTVREALERAGLSPSVEEFSGTPTASIRSLFTSIPFPYARNPNEIEILKLSLSTETSGSSRKITRKNLIRSINGSRMVREAHERTAGKTPLSGFDWIYKPEVMGAIPVGFSDRVGGGFIRRLHTSIVPKGIDPVPALGLNVKVGESGKTLLDILFEASGYMSRVEFIWDKLLAPHWELHLMLAFEDGEPLVAHGQNNGYLLDERNQVLGIYVQDFSNAVDPSVRWFNGLRTRWIVPHWAKSSDYSLSEARSKVFESLSQFRRYFLLNVVALRLNDADKAYLQRKMNAALLTFAREKLGVSARSESEFLDKMRGHLRAIDRMDVIDLPMPPTAPATATAAGRAQTSFVEQSIHAPISPREANRLALDSYRTLGGETFANGEVILMKPKEYDVAVKSAHQQLRAVRAFLEEIRSGGTLWSSIMPKAIVDESIEKFGLRRRLSEARPDDLLTIYASADFLRDGKSGRLFPLELQISPAPGAPIFQQAALDTAILSYEGLPYGDGLADLPSVYREYQAFVTKALGLDHPARIVYLDYHPHGLQNLFDSNSPEVAQLAAEAKVLAQVPGVDLVTTDIQDELERNLGEITGICLSCDGNQIGLEQGGTTSLRFTQDGVWFQRRRGGRVVEEGKVDLVVNRIYRLQVPYLISKLGVYERRGQVITGTNPLALLASSKVFQAFIPQFIKLYLKEDPLLPPPETLTFFDVDGNFNESSLKRVLDSIEDYILKPSFGFGGKSIIFGSTIANSPAKLRNLAQEIQRYPTRYIAQRLVAPSLTPEAISGTNRLTHLRFFTSLIGQHTWTHRMGFATLAPYVNDGTTLTNISKNGPKSHLGLVMSLTGMNNPTGGGDPCDGLLMNISAKGNLQL